MYEIILASMLACLKGAIPVSGLLTILLDESHGMAHATRALGTHSK
jgi:hypothetical protein